MNGLLVVERIILESIEKGRATLEEICTDTGLSIAIVNDIVSRFIEENYLISKSKKIEINRSNKEWLNSLRNKKAAAYEVKELFQSIVKNKIDEDHGTLKLQKVSLNANELWLFEEKLRELEQFINSIKERRKMFPTKELTKDKKVIIWAAASYGEIINSLVA